ncbi:hypothetical protein [Streptosporangium sp. NPDC003464]
MPPAAVEYVASLVKVEAGLLPKYSWRSRTIERLGGQAEVDLSLAQPLGHDLRARLKEAYGDAWMLGDEVLDRFGDREQGLRGE